MTQVDYSENWLEQPVSAGSTSAPAGKRKRIRDNHNELERIRRTIQKNHLDALRQCLPYEDMDERASMVNIFIRGREYIKALEQRVDELQRMLVKTGVQSPHPQPPQAVPQGFQAQSNFGGFDPHLKSPMPVVMHGGVQFYNPSYSLNQSPSRSLSPLAESAALVAANISEHDIQVKPKHAAASSSPRLIAPCPDPLRQRTSSAETIDAQQLFDFIIDSHPDAQQLMLSAGADLRRRKSSAVDEAMLRNFKHRRESSLLLPFGDQAGAMLFQKRDSLSTLFSGILPGIVSESFADGEIKCKSCSLGMCNQIMIDCDRCRAWFHIRCLRIDANSIPTAWTCPSCTK